MQSTNGKLSVVIPAWSGTPELADMAYRLCKKVKPMCDELLVGEDSGIYYEMLDQIADRYFLHPENLGDVVNINYLMKQSTGDFICSINTDIEILLGDIRDLCVPDRLVGVGGPRFTGSFFCIDRLLLDSYGYLDETKQHAWKSGPLGMGADMEWELRYADKLFLSNKVKAHHGTGVSYAEKRRLGHEAYLKSQKFNKEIDPQRHIQRLQEDEEYRKWMELSQS